MKCLRILKVLLISIMIFIVGCSGNDDSLEVAARDATPEPTPVVTPYEPSQDATPEPTPVVTPDLVNAPENTPTSTIPAPTPEPTPYLSGEVTEALIWPASLILSESEADTNTELVFQVWIDSAGIELSAADITISFDKDVLEAVSVSYGNSLGPAPVVGYKELDNSSGLIKYAIARYGSSTGYDATGILARLNFRLKDSSNAGATAISLKVKLADGRFKMLSPAVRDGATIKFGE